MLAIIDYGVGNVFSLSSSLKSIGEEAVITNDPETIRKADRIILPGVGAFEDAIAKLREHGMADIVKEEAAKGKPVMGICLGMQLLLELSEEYGTFEGLGLVPGKCKSITEVIPADYKVPHMGWNALTFKNGKHPLFKYIEEGEYVYFVHSFAGFECADYTIATTEYGAPLTAAVANGNVMGCQFHPEKSGEVGLRILKSFCEMKEGSIC